MYSFKRDATSERRTDRHYSVVGSVGWFRTFNATHKTQTFHDTGQNIPRISKGKILLQCKQIWKTQRPSQITFTFLKITGGTFSYVRQN